MTQEQWDDVMDKLDRTITVREAKELYEVKQKSTSVHFAAYQAAVAEEDAARKEYLIEMRKAFQAYVKERAEGGGEDA